MEEMARANMSVMRTKDVYCLQLLKGKHTEQ